MAYKDEYEVARLYTDGEFLKKLGAQFEGDYKLTFHLAPPLFADRDPTTGQLKKREYGAWMLQAFRLLASLKRLRGTRLDVFGYTEERKMERRLIGEYEATIDSVLVNARPEQSRDGGADRRCAGDHARLRPRQGEEREGGQGARSLAARRLSLARQREGRGGVADARRTTGRHRS